MKARPDSLRRNGRIPDGWPAGTNRPFTGVRRWEHRPEQSPAKANRKGSIASAERARNSTAGLSNHGYI